MEKLGTNCTVAGSTAGSKIRHGQRTVVTHRHRWLGDRGSRADHHRPLFVVRARRMKLFTEYLAHARAFERLAAEELDLAV